jgi:hypothetical protein
MHLHSAAAVLDLGSDLGRGDASAVRLGQYLEETLVTVKTSVNSRIAPLNQRENAIHRKLNHPLVFACRDHLAAAVDHNSQL